jgi:hypothetical protein
LSRRHRDLERQVDLSAKSSTVVPQVPKVRPCCGAILWSRGGLSF